MKYLSLFIKGFLIGIAKIIPGVSGAILAISFGVYERFVYIVGHPFKIKLDDLKFLFFLLLGAGIGIVLLCDVIEYLLNYHRFITVCLFLGLIMGGIPSIIDEIKTSKIDIVDILIFLVSFLLVIFIVNLGTNEADGSKHYFIMGAIESLTTIVPGISGTAIFMALGWYESLLETIKSVLTFKADIFVTLNFISGFIVSTILVSKVLSYSLKKYKKRSYMCILGFVGASLFQMVSGLFAYYSLPNLLIFISVVSAGYYATTKLDSFFGNY